jgi:hypothetical protein
LSSIVLAVTAVKLASEAAVLRHRRDPRHSVAKRMAIVMLGDLRGATNARFGCALGGSLLAPIVVALTGSAGWIVVPVALLMVALLLAGELAERYLFFRAAPPSRMPGGIP